MTVSCAFTGQLTLTIGGNNLFNVYSEKWKNTRDGDTGQAVFCSHGQMPYIRSASQCGFNGACEFVTASVKFQGRDEDEAD